MSEAGSPQDLYSLHQKRNVRLRVYYPKDLDQLVLRRDSDWDADVLPRAIDRSSSFAEFELETTHPFFYVKPCLRTPAGLAWATGPNRLVVATREGVQDFHPAFFSSENGRILDIITLESKILDRQHRLRVYLPAGYDENTCRTFPVMYMQDGSKPVLPGGSVHGTGLGDRR